MKVGGRGGGGGPREGRGNGLGKVDRVKVVVYWLLYVPATSLCISGTDLLIQFCVLLH